MTSKSFILNTATFCLAGLVGSSTIMEAYDSGREAGYVDGSSAGFVAGLKMRKEPPKIYIITPKPDGTFSVPKKEVGPDSVLWRI